MTRDETLVRLVELRGETLYWKISGKPVKLRDDSKGYPMFSVRAPENRRYKFSVHRVLWFLYHGEWPKQTIDHINRDRSDNRLANLRDVSQRENNQNRGQYARRARPTARHIKTVRGWVRQRSTNCWVAFVKPKSIRVYLGAFATCEEANAAREGAARLLEALRDPEFTVREEPASQACAPSRTLPEVRNGRTP